MLLFALLVLVYARGLLGLPWTSPLVQLMTEERWPQDAEDLSQCLSQQQSLQLKEEEDIPQRPKKYQFTDGCACTGPSYIVSVDSCIHASSWHRASNHIDVRTRRMHQTYAPRASWIDVSCLNCIELHSNALNCIELH